MTFIKNILMGLFVLIISAGVFFYLVKDQPVKDNILKTTLELFGDDLFAMYPDGEQKEKLRQKYDVFLKRTEEDEVPQEEIERVAAGILNFTSMEHRLPPELVMQFLDGAALDSITNDSLQPLAARDRSMRPMMPGNPRFPFPPKRPDHVEWDPESKKEFAEHLKEIKLFHEEMQRLWENDSTMRDLQNQVFFSADSGLKVTIDVNMRDLMQQRADKMEKLKDLEKQRIIVWNQQQIDEKQLQAIKLGLQHIPGVGKELKAVIELTDLPDSLLHNYHYEFNTDSLEKVIELRLEELIERNLQELDSLQ